MKDNSKYAKNMVLESILTRMGLFIKVNGTTIKEKGGERLSITMEIHFRVCLMSRINRVLPNGINGRCRVK